MKKQTKILLIAAIAAVIACAIIAGSLSKGKKDEIKCSVTVNCRTAVECEGLPSDIKDVLPKDGTIADKETVSIESGSTALDVLQAVCREKKVQLEFEEAAYGAYIEGVNNLYNGDCGELSGWLFCVNGVCLTESCGKYVVQEGDEIQFLYSCDMGADLGIGF